MPKLSLDLVLAALRTVPHPELKKDLVALGMIRDLQLGEEGGVSLKLFFTPPRGALQPLQQAIESEVRAALATLPGVGEVRLRSEMATPSGASNGSRVGAIPGVAHVIAVSSGKGGVGKSTVAVNLATALAMQGARVGLMDADVYGPNVPTMMGVTDSPQIDAVTEKNGQTSEIFLPPSAHGVKVMSMGFLMPPDQPAIWRGPMLHSLVSQFCHKVRWGELDYLIVDMPPGTGDVQLSLAQLVPVSGAVLVTTPQEVSTQDVRRAFHMFEKVRVPVLGVVENMSYFKCDSCDKKHFLFGQDGGLRLSRKFGTDLLARLPLLPGVREGGDQGLPIVIGSPNSEAALGFQDLARRVVQRLSVLNSAEVAGSGAGIQIGSFN